MEKENIMGRPSKYSASFKARVALEAMKECETLESLARKYELSPSIISRWRDELIGNAEKVFDKSSCGAKELKRIKAQNDRLLHKVGQLTVECDFFAKACEDARSQGEIIELKSRRPVGMSRQPFCKYLKLNRSTLYYKAKGESEENLKIMEIMDRHYLEHPTSGVLTMVSVLGHMGYNVNPKRVRRLLCLMGILAIYPKKSLSVGSRPQNIYPYLLRDIEITRPNQVWSTDISYIPMEGSFVYLYAVIDVYSRFIVGWQLSNRLSAINCYELVEDCIRMYGAPEIINSDQGSQYTTHKWKQLLSEHGVSISMDGKGRCKDNIWIERFWRTVKQEYIYINPTDSVQELRLGIGKFIKYYNFKRPHQGLSGDLPTMKYGVAA